MEFALPTTEMLLDQSKIDVASIRKKLSEMSIYSGKFKCKTAIKDCISTSGKPFHIVILDRN